MPPSPKKQSPPETTALDLTQAAIKGYQRIEKLIQDAKLAADPKARKRGMPGSTALLRITGAILELDWTVTRHLNEWAQHEDYWTRFERNKARRDKAKRKRK